MQSKEPARRLVFVEVMVIQIAVRQVQFYYRITSVFPDYPTF